MVPIPSMVPYLNLKFDEDNNQQSWQSFFSSDAKSNYENSRHSWKIFPVNATSVGLIVFILLTLYLINRKIIRIKWILLSLGIGKRVLSKTGQTIKRRKKGTAIKRWLLQKLPTRLSSV